MASNYNRRSNSSGSNANSSSSSNKKPPTSKGSSSLDRSRAGYYATTHHTTGTDSYAKNTTWKKSDSVSPTRSRGTAASPSRSPQTTARSGGVRPSAHDSRSYSHQPSVSRTSRSGSAQPSTSSRPSRSGSVQPSNASRSTRSGSAYQSTASRTSRPTSGYRSSDDNRSASNSRYSSNRSSTSSQASASSSSRRVPPAYGSSSRSSGVSVREIRASQRNQEQARLRRQFIKRIIAIAVALLVVFGGALGIYLSPLFSVETVTVSGASYLTEQEVLDLADVPDTATLLRFDKKDVLARLEANPWIEKATIKRKLFNGLEISVVERKLAAVVQVPIDATGGGSSKWAISTDGVWLTRIDEAAYTAATASTATSVASAASGTTEQSVSLTQRVAADAVGKPIISDAIPKTAPEAGAQCTDEGIMNALKILSTISRDLLDQVVSVSAVSASATSLTLENKVVVAFGSSDDALTKERIILQLLEEHAGQISYINVRVVDRPAWRGVG